MVTAFMLAAAGGALGVSFAPSAMVTGAVFSASPFTTSPVLALVSGGSGSYTYAWTEVGGDVFFITILSPTSASTDFTWAGFPPFVPPKEAIVRCTVTDTVSGATAYADLFLQHTYYP